MSQAFRIPTIVPRDLLPRPETTLLRVVVTSAIPVLVMFALVMKGVPAEWLLVVLMMIISQVSMAVTQAQKEMLAASSSYFRPGLGRRVAMAQLAWGLALPAAATLALALLGGDRQPALLGSAFGLAMLVHALMAWATLRM
ncbi:MAG TPA: hypothetical protein PLQ13_09860, partial [Candidatus Krumholzibacteria bacterium]|nr:hypothetical protein [Candidatus Krumholzibacteria bacterium]